MEVGGILWELKMHWAGWIISHLILGEPRAGYQPQPAVGVPPEPVPFQTSCASFSVVVHVQNVRAPLNLQPQVYSLSVVGS